MGRSKIECKMCDIEILPIGPEGLEEDYCDDCKYRFIKGRRVLPCLRYDDDDVEFCGYCGEAIFDCQGQTIFDDEGLVQWYCDDCAAKMASI
jgi:hypothetical protein